MGTVGPHTTGTPGGIPRAGDMVAGLLLEERIGAGGMGVVFRAYDPSVDRIVAVKVVTPRVAADPGFRVRLLQEAAAAERVRHPNVVRVHDVGVTPDDITYIVMHHVAGPNLARLVERDGPLPPRLAGRMLGQIAGALDAVHRAGLLHRDVKPGNILWEPESGTAYLADFGLAAAMGDGGRTGTGGFTAGYAPPEQLRGEDLLPAADIYALACTFFQCVTGRPPFTGDPEEVRLGHLAGTPPRPADIAPHLPRGIDEVFARALMKDQAQRFRHAGEFAANVRSLRRDAVFVAEGASPDADVLARLLEEDGWDAGVADALDVRRTEACLGVARTAGVVVTSATVPATSPQVAAVRAALDADPLLRVVVVLTGDAPRPNAAQLGPLRGFGWFDLRDHVSGDQAAAFRGAVERTRPGPPAAAGEACPYPGLGGFGRDDARFFSGRDRERARARGLLTAHRFVALVGASGSGKSSLLRAGLLSSGAGDGAVVVTPGDRPLERLRAVLDAGRRTFIAVDQFEELFTADVSPEARAAFVDRLLAFRDDVPDGRIAIAVRADFMGMCAEFPALRDAISRSQLLLGPMGPEDLRRALEEPARAAGLQLAPGLTERVVEEAGSLTGALPLVSDLMRQVWERRHQDTLTMEALVHVGGVRGALGRRADTAYAELVSADRPLAREVLLRLVTPGEGTADSRRRAAMPELLAGLDPAAARRVLDTLVAHRLLTVDRNDPDGEPSVDIVHEALITGWPRLREWVDGHREELVQRSRLTTSAERWAESGEDEAHLLRGSALAIAQELDPAPLPDAARRLVEESTAAAQRERVAERRRFRRTITGLSVGVAITSVLAVVAFVQSARVSASDRRTKADLLIARSEGARSRDPALSLALAEDALRARIAPKTVANLRAARAVPAPVRQRQVADGTDPVDAVPIDENLALTVGVGGVSTVDNAGTRNRSSRTDFRPEVIRLADGSMLAVGHAEPRFVLLSSSGKTISTGTIKGVPLGEIRDAAVSADSGWLALLVRPGVTCTVPLAPGRRWAAGCSRVRGIRDPVSVAVDERGSVVVAGEDGLLFQGVNHVAEARPGFVAPEPIPALPGCVVAATGTSLRRVCSSGPAVDLAKLEATETITDLAIGTVTISGRRTTIAVASAEKDDDAPSIRVFTATSASLLSLTLSSEFPVAAEDVKTLAIDGERGRLVATSSRGTLTEWALEPLVLRTANLPEIPGPPGRGKRYLHRLGDALIVDGVDRFDGAGRALPPSPPNAQASPTAAIAWAPRSDAQAQVWKDLEGRRRLDVFHANRWEERALARVATRITGEAFSIGDGGDVAMSLTRDQLALLSPGGDVHVVGRPAKGDRSYHFWVSPSGRHVAGVDRLTGRLRWWSIDEPEARLQWFDTGGRGVSAVAFSADARTAAVLTSNSVFIAPVGAMKGVETRLDESFAGAALNVDDVTGLVLVRGTGGISVIDPSAGTVVWTVSAAAGNFTPVDIAYDPSTRSITSLLHRKSGAGWVVEHRVCSCMDPVTGP